MRNVRYKTEIWTGLQATQQWPQGRKRVSERERERERRVITANLESKGGAEGNDRHGRVEKRVEVTQ